MLSHTYAQMLTKCLGNKQAKSAVSAHHLTVAQY